MIHQQEITFFVTAYERYDYFENSVYSLLNQTVKPTTIIVIDDCSSHSRFEDFVKSVNDPSLSYVRNEKNMGLTGTWNRCIDLCKTKWMTILHDDDCLHLEYLAKMLEVAKEVSPKTTVLSCRASVGPEVFFGKSRLNGVRKFPEEEFLFNSPSQFPGILFEVDAAKKAGYFNDDYYPCSDMKLWLDLTKAGAAYLLREPLAFYRLSSNQVTASKFLTILNQACRIKNEILKDKSTSANRLLARQSTINQFNTYLQTYNLTAATALEKLDQNDCAYDIVLRYCKDQENPFGRMKTALQALSFKALVNFLGLTSLISPGKK